MATSARSTREAIVAAARETGAIVTVEEHTVYGGLGSAVAEVVVRPSTRCRCASWACRACSRRPARRWLLEHFGLTAAGHLATPRWSWSAGASGKV